jgi:NTP pyrophosphatase (non-canonical NTP hydrolase)
MNDEIGARQIADELADVFIYLVRLSDILGVDLLEAARAKLEANARRYPADRVRGSADKAPPLEGDG